MEQNNNLGLKRFLITESSEVRKLEPIQAISSIKDSVSVTNQDPFRQTAIDLYNTLNSIYSSPYFSNPDERLQAIKLLEAELRKGLNPKYLVYKMNQLTKVTEFKSKIYSVIMDRFWDRDFVKGVEFVPFDPSKNL